MDKTILTAIEANIKRISKDIAQKHGIVGSDKINSYAKLLNAYNRLLLVKSSSSQETKYNHHEFLENMARMKN